MSDPAATFEPHRRRLLGLAYRMLGSMADAEDAAAGHADETDPVLRLRIAEPVDARAELAKVYDQALAERPGLTNSMFMHVAEFAGSGLEVEKKEL